MNLEFPLVVSFNLDKVRNSDSWDDDLGEKLIDLINFTNKRIVNHYSEEILTSRTTDIILSSESNVKSINSNLPNLDKNYIKTIKANFPDNLEKRMFYIILESKGSKISLDFNSNINVHNNSTSFNRTLYIFRKLNNSQVILFKVLKDIYQPNSNDFDMGGFTNGDLE